MPTWAFAYLRRVVDELKELANDIKDDSEVAGYFGLKDLVSMIHEAYKTDNHVSIVIQGQRGHGKTTLMLHILAHVYAHRGNPRYNVALKYVFFQPQEAISFIHQRLLQGRPIIALGLDDAGVWISRWILTKEKSAFLEMSNLFREAVASVIYTDVKSIHKYIRETSNIIIFVRKLKPDLKKLILHKLYREFPDKANIIEYYSQFDWSEARVYESTFNVLMKHYIHRHSIMYFPLAIPKPIRNRYKKIRREYTIKLAEKVLEEILLKSQLEEFKLKKLELTVQKLEAQVKMLMAKTGRKKD